VPVARRQGRGQERRLCSPHAAARTGEAERDCPPERISTAKLLGVTPMTSCASTQKVGTTGTTGSDQGNTLAQLDAQPCHQLCQTNPQVKPSCASGASCANALGVTGTKDGISKHNWRLTNCPTSAQGHANCQAAQRNYYIRDSASDCTAARSHVTLRICRTIWCTSAPGGACRRGASAAGPPLGWKQH
jgi:hypothetical protein